MAKLLYIESSPRKERSASIAVSRAFLDSYRSSHPDDEIELWDLWREPLKEFDQDALDAKYAVIHQEQQSPGQKAAWAKVTALADRFKRPDKLMWLRFIGITDIESILIEGTLHGPDKMKPAKAAGAGKAREIARSY